MNDYALNKEQQELAANNHNLIYKYAKIREIDIEEYYGVLAIGLCKAAKIFDSARGLKFSTLAYRCMKTELLNYWRDENTSKHIPFDKILSFDMPIVNSEGEESTLLNFLADKIGYFDDPTNRVIMKDFFESLSEKERIVLNGRWLGYTLHELGDYLSCTREYVRQIEKKIQRKWMKYGK